MNRLRHRITAATATSLCLAAIAAGCSSGNDDATAPADPSSTPPAATTTTRPGARAARYRDGEYRARGWYGGLPSSIVVAVTLRDDRITDVRVTATATNRTSRDLQQHFAAAVPAVVVGRRIDEVRVSRMAGSSDTPNGFNDALEKIRREAAR